MKDFLTYVLAAVVAAVVVDGLDKVNPRAAVMLAVIIVLLVLMSRRGVFEGLGV